MIYELISNIPNNVLTLDIGDVTFKSDKPATFVAFINSTTVYRSEYIPSNNNIISVRNLRDIIEKHMIILDCRICSCFLSFDIGDDCEYSTSFVALFCNSDFGINFENCINSCFLTSLRSKSTCAGAKELLSFIAKSNVQVFVKGVYVNDIGDSKNFSFLLKEIESSQLSIFEIDVSHDVVISHIPDACALKAYTVICDNKFLPFFVDSSLEDALFFSFKNCFNVTETVIVKGAITKINDIKSDVVALNSSSSIVNRTNSCKFEVETDIMMFDYAEWFAQFLSSHNIQLLDSKTFRGGVDVSISECEFTQPYNSTQAAKFTWLFNRNVPRSIFKSDIIGSGIFSNEFDFQYG